MKAIQIKNIKHLKEVFENAVKDKYYTEQIEGFIMLNNNLRSSKTFFVYQDRGLSIFHSVDGEIEEFDNVEEMLKGMNNIKEAIEKKAFFVEV